MTDHLCATTPRVYWWYFLKDVCMPATIVHPLQRNVMDLCHAHKREIYWTWRHVIPTLLSVHTNCACQFLFSVWLYWVDKVVTCILGITFTLSKVMVVESSQSDVAFIHALCCRQESITLVITSRSATPHNQHFAPRLEKTSQGTHIYNCKRKPQGIVSAWLKYGTQCTVNKLDLYSSLNIFVKWFEVPSAFILSLP